MPLRKTMRNGLRLEIFWSPCQRLPFATAAGREASGDVCEPLFWSEPWGETHSVTGASDAGIPSADPMAAARRMAAMACVFTAFGWWRQFADEQAVVNAGKQSNGLVALFANVLVLFVFRVRRGVLW